jgi:hypothetical protein
MLKYPFTCCRSNTQISARVLLLCVLSTLALPCCLVFGVTDHDDGLQASPSDRTFRPVGRSMGPKGNSTAREDKLYDAADQTLWLPDLAGLILPWGYPLESHWVLTSDGYILEVFRLPQRHLQPLTPKRNPILLVHGLLV